MGPLVASGCTGRHGQLPHEASHEPGPEDGRQPAVVPTAAQDDDTAA